MAHTIRVRLEEVHVVQECHVALGQVGSVYLDAVAHVVLGESRHGVEAH